MHRLREPVRFGGCKYRKLFRFVKAFFSFLNVPISSSILAFSSTFTNHGKPN